MERVLTGNKWDVGDRVAPSDSAAETPGCIGSAGGGLIGRSRGGLDAESGEDGFTEVLRRLAAALPG